MRRKPVDPFDRHRRKRPWAEIDGGGVPWEMRTYAFNTQEGKVDVLEEGFKHLVGPDGKSVTCVKVPNTLRRGPEHVSMTLPEVEALWIECERDDTALRVGFARLKGQDKITTEQFRWLSQANDYYPYAPKGAQQVIERDDSKMLEEFKAQAFGTQKPSKRESVGV